MRVKGVNMGGCGEKCKRLFSYQLNVYHVRVKQTNILCNFLASPPSAVRLRPMLWVAHTKKCSRFPVPSYLHDGEQAGEVRKELCDNADNSRHYTCGCRVFEKEHADIFLRTAEQVLKTLWLWWMPSKPWNNFWAKLRIVMELGNIWFSVEISSDDAFVSDDMRQCRHVYFSLCVSFSLSTPKSMLQLPKHMTPLKTFWWLCRRASAVKGLAVTRRVESINTDSQ